MFKPPKLTTPQLWRLFDLGLVALVSSSFIWNYIAYKYILYPAAVRCSYQQMQDDQKLADIMTRIRKLEEEPED
jgi:hypothetical protein